MNEQLSEIRTDIVVVGGGLAGLTAARLLQVAGARTVLVEPHGLGGRGATDDRHGFLFNRGPHALYLAGHARRVFDQLGVALLGGAPGGPAAGLRGETMGALPAGAASLARTTLLGLKGKVAFGRLMARLPKIATAPLAGIAFADWLDQHQLPDDAREVVEAIGRLSSYANASHLVSAEVVVSQIQLAVAGGVRYLHGGWQTIADQLADGVPRVVAGATAMQRDGADVVVDTDTGTRVIASAAVLAVGTPGATAALLGREPFDVGPPIEAACLDLGVDQPSSPSLLLGIDQPLYLSHHCPPARLAPAGRSVVHVAKYLAPGDATTPAEQRAELVAHAAAAGVAPGRVLEQRYLHRMTVAAALPTAASGGFAGRPRVGDSGVAGVFLAGDWVGPEGHLLDASVASAEAAVGAALSAAKLAVR